jgi:endonuclease G, mitochondrial
MFTRAGKPDTVVAELHFAGEAAGSPDEHTLACLPGSVFEKLDISLHPPSAEEVEVVGGFDSRFVDIRVEVLELGVTIRDDAGGYRGRRHDCRAHPFLATNERLSAVRVLGRLEHRRRRVQGAEPQRDQICQGPAGGPGDQVGNELYIDNDLDRGYLARRADLVWGSLQVAEKANTDSF